MTDRCQVIAILHFVVVNLPSGGWTFRHVPDTTALSTCDTGGRPPTPGYMDPASWPITCEWSNLTMCSPPRPPEYIPRWSRSLRRVAP